jgi:hypothetical protein
MADDGIHATHDGLFKGGLLAGGDADVGEFENHVGVPWGVRLTL